MIKFYSKCSGEFPNQINVSKFLTQWAKLIEDAPEPDTFDIFAKKNTDGTFRICTEDENPDIIFKNCILTNVT